MRLLISLFLLFQTVFADEIVKPHRKFQTSGIVLDFRFFKNKIYAGTDAGTVDIFDLKTGKMEKQIKMKPLPDFYSGTIPAKVYSVSLFQDLMLILSEAEYGGRELSLYQNGKLKHILTTRSPIKKVELINDVICIYATLGNELVLYDLYNNREIYHIQISSSTFSDFAIQGDLIAMASESGEISLRNFWTGEEVQVLKGENLDNIYKVDFKNHIIAGSGQDRRLSIYNLKDNSHFHILTDFLIYSVGLSPDGTLALFPYKQNNDMKLISTKDGTTLKIFTDLTATLNRIIFLNNHTALTSSDENQIIEWIF